jgi:hypothetical protein
LFSYPCFIQIFVVFFSELKDFALQLIGIHYELGQLSRLSGTGLTSNYKKCFVDKYWGDLTFELRYW